MKADQVVKQLSVYGWSDLASTLQLHRIRHIPLKVRLGFLTQVKDIVEHMPRAMVKYSVLLSALVVACMESTEVSFCFSDRVRKKSKWTSRYMQYHSDG